MLQCARATKASIELFLQASRAFPPTPGQRPNHQPIAGVHFWQERLRRVPQPAGDPMAVDCRTDGFTHHEPNPGTIATVGIPASMNDKIRQSSPHPVLDGGTELGRACHPVSSRQHVDCRRIRPSANGDPCDADPSQSPARPGCACADGSRELSRDADCSAETCAYPWPPVYLLIKPDGLHAGGRLHPSCSCGNRRSRRMTRTLPYRRLSGDRLRLLTTLAQVKPHQLATAANSHPLSLAAVRKPVNFCPGFELTTPTVRSGSSRQESSSSCESRTI